MKFTGICKDTAKFLEIEYFLISTLWLTVNLYEPPEHKNTQAEIHSPTKE